MTGLGHGQAGRLRGRARSGALLVNAWRQTSTATRQREGHWNRTNVSGKWADKGRVCAGSAPSPRAAGTPAIRCFAHAGQREMMMSRRPPCRSVPSLSLCVRGTDPRVGIGNLLAQEEPTMAGRRVVLVLSLPASASWCSSVVFQSRL